MNLPDENQIQQFVQAIVDKSIEGVPPLTSAESLALEYLIDYSYDDDGHRVKSLINWETTKNFTTGFITGLGGLITLPISLPAAFGASWVIQARMAGAIALICGHDLHSERVRTMVLLSLLGDAVEQVLKEVGVKIAQKVTAKVLEQIPGKVFIEINKKIGFRLLTKAGEKGTINFMKGIPWIGGPVSGFLDAAACQTVGRVAYELFRREADTIHTPDDVAHLVGMYNGGKISLRYGGIAIKDHRRLVLSCPSEAWNSVGMLTNHRFQGAIRGDVRGMHQLEGTETGFKGVCLANDECTPIEWVKDR
jgi:uncharacterized protein (DUF697 family)